MCLNINLPVLITAIVLAAGTAVAQLPADSGAVVTAPGAGMPPHAMMAIHAEHADDMDVAPVKGAPFCATITTEHTQPFADGNRIHTTDSSTMCRDSEGRTRRESSLNLLGAAPQKSTSKLVRITDPVAGYCYLLNPDTKIAHKMALPSSHGAVTGGPDSMGGMRKEKQVMIYQATGDVGPTLNVFYKKAGPAADEPAPTTENLGDETIAGVHAAGTRVITTIPAGQMGSDQPISVTSERWYSPELKVTVMTKHNDPWAGELKTEFTNVNTSEPAVSLFTIPSDYRIMEDKEGPMLLQLPDHLPPPPR